MKRQRVWSVVAVVLWTAVCPAKDAAPSLMERDALTNGFWGLNDRLQPVGLDLSLSTTQIYQQNVHGGRSTSRSPGRWSGSYDLELWTNLRDLLGVEAGRIYTHAEGNGSRGIDPYAVGSYFNVNGDAFDDRVLDVTELWYEKAWLDGMLTLRVGKIDFTGGFECRGCLVSFDGSLYANDETSQFLNLALVNNPTIPFPLSGLGAILHCMPADWWYVSAGVQDAEGDRRTSGFATTFDGDDYFLYLLETAVFPRIHSAQGPLPAAYRFGLWYDPQPKGNSDSDRTYRNDVGFYTTCDQMLLKENDQPDDRQGLGMFFRCGYTDGRRNDLTQFYSGGFQYQGLVAGRDEDVFGIGYARGIFSAQALTTFPAGHESVLETYYNAQLTKWAHVSPSVQYVATPGGCGRDAVVVGVRAQITF
jgi:porin